MNLWIKGKTALVTGGAQGIGRAVTLALLAEGCRVYFTTRNSDAFKEMEKEGAQGILTELHPYTCKYLPDDVDILVNNAGSTLNVQDPHCSLDDLERVMSLNFKVPFAVTERVLPYMKRQKWGRIVNITSCGGMENRGPWTFCAAKAALTAYTRSMGRILATEEPGIVMSAVYPGVVLTESGHWQEILKERPEHWEKYKKEIPVGRFGQPEEIAAQVAFLCSESASFHHGAIIGVDGGLSKGFAHHL